MEILRTPDERFTDLPGDGFEPHDAEIDDTDGGFLRVGAKGRPHTTIDGAGHFLQEDRGEELARVVVDFVERTT